MLHLEDLEIYRLALDIGEEAWQLAASLPTFAQQTMGNQLVRSADSIGANMAEGFGRFHYKDNKTVCYYTRGSLLETKTWLHKAGKRNLVPEMDLARLNETGDLAHKA